MYECLAARMYVYHVQVWCPQRIGEGIRSPETQVTDGCELPDLGAGNPSWILCKSSKCLYLQSHLNDPFHLIFKIASPWLGPLPLSQTGWPMSLREPSISTYLNAEITMACYHTQCGGLNKNSPHRSIGSGTIRRCGFVGVGVPLLEECIMRGWALGS